MLLLAAVFCLLAAVYPIAMYPVAVSVLARLRPRPWRQGPVDGPAAHIVTVFNEERRIASKLENTARLVPPRGGLETVVVSDGSNDRTAQIVAQLADETIRFMDLPRQGKERAQLAAIASTTAPFIVFSDASAMLEVDALQQVLAPFADSRVAAVSGTDELSGDTGGSGESLYVGYEMRLRRSEALIETVVGLSGCFFAARRDVAERLLADVPSDMGAALIALATRRRAVPADGARCRYTATPRVAREFARKRRTALRGLRGLWAYRSALRNGTWVARWQLVSHKWLRFAVPWWLAAGFVCCGVAAGQGEDWAVGVTAIALLAGSAAALGLVAARLRSVAPIRAASFFFLTNAAVMAAWLDWLRGSDKVQWIPTER